MKKNKLVGIAAMMLAVAGMVACGGGGEAGGDSSSASGTTSSKSSTHKHSYGDYVVTKEATCTTAGSKERTCTDCGYKDVKEVKATGHAWVADPSNTAAGAVAATCEEGGKEWQKCSNKGCTETQLADTAALGHEMVDDGDPTPATCTEAGSQNKKCSRTGCDHTEVETIQALGHAWETDADKTPVPATCEEDGKNFEKCTRAGCTEEREVKVDKLGHNLTLVGGEITPEEGKAAVRLYSCDREGCNVEYMGFKATEVSTASKTHLTFTGEGEDAGASFWGRPIGNAVVLDETGSASRDAHEAVFDKKEEGDFFEYVFDLTEEQAAKLNSCKLYCDAKPSDYMGQNNVDFWKVKGDASSDWTYGMYIDDAPEHLNEDGTGKIIEDFRYVLYVDGDLKQMDYSIDTPVPQGDPRGEYVLPYTFNLHKGENKIKLVMAGGYRSTFYNFTFRPYEAPAHTHEYGEWTTTTPATCDTAGEKKQVCSCGDEIKETIPATGHTWVEDACACGAKLLKAAASTAVFAEGSSNKSGTPEGYMKLSGNNQSASFTITSPKAGKATLALDGMMDSWPGNGSQGFYNNDNHTTNPNFEIKVNDTVLADLPLVKGKSFNDLGCVDGETIDGKKYSAQKMISLAEVDVNEGANTIVLKRLQSYNYLVSSVCLIVK